MSYSAEIEQAERFELSVAGRHQYELGVDFSPGFAVEVTTEQGPPGPPGSGAAYTHTQGAPSTEWTVNHNLGYKPAVELYGVGGRAFNAEVLHTSDNQFIVYLTTATAGTARCV